MFEVQALQAVLSTNVLAHAADGDEMDAIQRGPIRIESKGIFASTQARR